eukprot:SAG11_NODE_7077_length_1198_cov_0.958144_1_plen_378_part_01
MWVRRALLVLRLCMRTAAAWQGLRQAPTRSSRTTARFARRYVSKLSPGWWAAASGTLGGRCLGIFYFRRRLHAGLVAAGLQKVALQKEEVAAKKTAAAKKKAAIEGMLSSMTNKAIVKDLKMHHLDVNGGENQLRTRLRQALLKDTESQLAAAEAACAQAEEEAMQTKAAETAAIAKVAEQQAATHAARAKAEEEEAAVNISRDFTLAAAVAEHFEAERLATGLGPGPEPEQAQQPEPVGWFSALSRAVWAVTATPAPVLALAPPAAPVPVPVSVTAPVTEVDQGAQEVAASTALAPDQPEHIGVPAVDESTSDEEGFEDARGEAAGATAVPSAEEETPAPSTGLVSLDKARLESVWDTVDLDGSGWLDKEELKLVFI